MSSRQSWFYCVLMVCGQFRGDGGTLAGGSWLASFSAGASSLISRTPPLAAKMRYENLVALAESESSNDTKSRSLPPPIGCSPILVHIAPVQNFLRPSKGFERGVLLERPTRPPSPDLDLPDMARDPRRLSFSTPQVLIGKWREAKTTIACSKRYTQTFFA